MRDARLAPLGRQRRTGIGQLGVGWVARKGILMGPVRSPWVVNLDGGKIKDSRHYFDMLSFLQRPGVISC